MKNILVHLLILAAFFLLPITSFAQCQNRNLDFDGIDDYIDINATSLALPTTIEAWFKSTSTSTNSSCNGQGEILFSIGNGTASDFVEIGTCNGDLFINSVGGISTNPSLFKLLNTSVSPNAINIRGAWHHVSLTISPILGVWSYEVYLDCNLIYTTPWTGGGNQIIYIGKSQDPSTLSNTFKGQIDELRLWNTVRTGPELCLYKSCLSQANSNILTAYYKFDQGLASMSNLSETTLDNRQQNGQNGTLHNFGLMGNNSNWLCSSAPIVYPDLTEAILHIKDYPSRTNDLTKICSGDPVHFCLEVNDTIILPNPDIKVLWQYNNATLGSWVELDSNIFNGFCFAVPPGAMTIDCSTSLTGRENQAYRAVFTVYYNNKQDSCIYTSKVTKISICCSLDNTQVTATTSDPSNLLCDMDVADFQVSLTSMYPFLTIPASGVTIDWKYNGMALPQFSNQTSFSYPNIQIDINNGACFDAVVTSCNKTATFTKCFSIDPIPMCGTIKDAKNPDNLTWINNDIYEICPGDDAGLMIDAPFTDCTPFWQYSFDHVSWTDLGLTNSMQNTNILPSYLWPLGATEIYYRIECRPFSDPSGCDSCHSNEITIMLRADPLVGNITGANYVCFGSSTILTHNGLDPALTHQWYCNGDPVGNGSSTLSVTNGGCYWVESTDGCHRISTAKFCLDLCIITPVISCPDVCPRPGIPITLSACDSEDTCGQALSYQWAVSGSNTPTINGCMIRHVPSPGSNTYAVTVTNAYGCSASTSTTIVPCDQ